MVDLDASWWTIAPPLLIAALALAVPGGLVVAALRLRGLAAAALPPVASVALWASAGVLTQLTGPFTLPWTMSGLTIAVVGAAWLIGRGTARTRPAPRPRSGAARASARSGWIVVAAIAASAAAMGALTFLDVPSPALPNQTYDGIFHENLVLWMQSTGQQSAFQAYHVNDPYSANAFYPNAWHLLALVTATLGGASVPTAFAALWIAVCGLLWLPGIAWTADVLLRPRHRTVALVAAIVAGSAFPSFPYLLLGWGSLYPMMLATALAPVGLALVVLAVRWMRGTSRALPWPVLLAAGLGWLVAEGLSQPRGLFGFAVLVVPYLVWQGWAVLRWRRRVPSLRRQAARWAWGSVGVVVLIGAGGALPLLDLNMKAPVWTIFTGGGLDTSFTLWPARFTPLEGLYQALLLAPPTSPGDAVVLFPSLPLALATLGGVVLAARTRGLRWLLITWGAIVVLYLLAATSDTVAAKALTALWYKDKYRLLALLPVIGAPLVALVADRFAGLLRSRADARSAAGPIAGLLVAVVALVAWAGPTLPGAAARNALRFDVEGSTKAGRVVDADDLAVLEAARDIVPTGERLLGDPWQGAIAAWAFAGIEPVFPHYVTKHDPDRALLAKHAEEAGPEVCAALDRLDAHYLLVDAEKTSGSEEPGVYAFPGLAAEGATRLGPVVAAQGSASLIRITACG